MIIVASLFSSPTEVVETTTTTTTSDTFNTPSSTPYGASEYFSMPDMFKKLRMWGVKDEKEKKGK